MPPLLQFFSYCTGFFLQDSYLSLTLEVLNTTTIKPATIRVQTNSSQYTPRFYLNITRRNSQPKSVSELLYFHFGIFSEVASSPFQDKTKRLFSGAMCRIKRTQFARFLIVADVTSACLFLATPERAPLSDSFSIPY